MSVKTRSSTPKESLFKLLNCGSGKKSTKHSSKSFSPSNAPETKDDEDDHTTNEVTTVKAFPGHATDEEEVEISYTILKMIGKGTFGKVYKVKLLQDGSLMAIKKVLDDKRYKNRELMFMRRVQHPNIVDLKYYFYGDGEGCRSGERFLNMLLEFVPETLFSLTKCDGLYTKPLLDPTYIKLYMYQMFRSLNYLHMLNICHRDIKPQNLLLNTATHEIKLCDFGSAKELLQNETNIAYICSRYYRAPELLFGAKNYTCQIDMWSAGCVLSELYQGHPLFPGATGPDQMVEIMRVLGTPSHDDIFEINQHSHIRLPAYLAPLQPNKVFTKTKPSPEGLDLIYKLLVYSPSLRLTPLETLCHSYFDQIRSGSFTLPDGKRSPSLFNFTSEELSLCPTIRDRLQPANYMETYNNNNLESQINPDSTHSKTSSQNIKSKIMGLARNSFRRSSSKEKNTPLSPQHDDIELSHSLNASIDVPKFDIDAVDGEVSSEGKSRRRRRRKPEMENDESFGDETLNRMEDMNIQANDSSTKKKKHPKNETEINLEIPSLEIATSSEHKKKKHRHRRTDSQDIDMEVNVPTVESPEGNSAEKTHRRTKKKTGTEIFVDEIVTTTVTTSDGVSSKTKTKKSRRKKKLDYESDDDSLEESPAVRAIV